MPSRPCRHRPLPLLAVTLLASLALGCEAREDVPDRVEGAGAAVAAKAPTSDPATTDQASLEPASAQEASSDTTGAETVKEPETAPQDGPESSDVKPVKKEPVDEKPAKKEPVDEKPAEKEPVDEKPAEKETGAEKPGEGTSAEGEKSPDDAAKKRERPESVAASWILVQHAESQLIPGSEPTQRTREEAKQRAEEALAKLGAEGADFIALAEKYSDDPNAKKRQGKFGAFQDGQLPPQFAPISEALFDTLEVGEHSGVLDVPFGYVIVQRDRFVEYAASHVLITHKDSARPKPGVTRTSDEAKALAEKVRDEVQAGLDFADAAKKYSEGPSGPGGGSLGIFAGGQMVAAFEEALEKLKPGEISPPVETEFGWHVILRQKIDRVTAQHILITFTGSPAAKPTTTRTKEEAKVLAEQVLGEVRAEGAVFEELAKKYSEGPTGPRGGLLGTFGRGKMVPPFDKAVFELEPGGISDVVETRFGFHVIRRIK